MHLFSSFRKETDPELIAAATQAYAEARPEHTGNAGRFTAPPNAGGTVDSLAEKVCRNNGRVI